MMLGDKKSGYELEVMRSLGVLQGFAALIFFSALAVVFLLFTVSYQTHKINKQLEIQTEIMQGDSDD